MAIDANTRFKGVDNTLVDLQERRSTQINNETEFYSITDFSNAITGGVDIASLETQVNDNTSDISANTGSINDILSGLQAYVVTDMSVATIKTTFTPGARNTHLNGFITGSGGPIIGRPDFSTLQLTRTNVGVYETALNNVLFNNEFRLTIEITNQTLSPVGFYYTVNYNATGFFVVNTFTSGGGVTTDLTGDAIIKYTYYDV